MVHRLRFTLRWCIGILVFQFCCAADRSIADLQIQRLISRRLNNATLTQHAADVGVPKTATIAFAADSRYLPRLLAVVEKLRAMKEGKTYRLIAYNLGDSIVLVAYN